MIHHSAWVRTLLASAAIASAVALAGCQTEGISQIPSKAMQPLSRDMIAQLDKKNMPVDSPILLRIFKEEAELEVWKQDSTGHYSKLKTYPICRWSGELGPKVKQGDRQAPEGFYTISPGQMNPNSSYYLAFNLGFPNAYDRANERTGAFLMVHGDCTSSGCYAMTDDQIAEIYALGREAFLGGQKSFQVQAYPFRMTGINLARHRASPHMPFWRMLKEGNDHFEVTRQEPKVDVCEKRYVFNATPVGGSFVPTGRCPTYKVPDEVLAEVSQKREKDDREMAAHVNQGVRTAAVVTNNDGGMHPAFVAKLDTSAAFESNGRKVAPLQHGAKPTLVYVPRNVDTGTTSSVFGARVASADPGDASAFATSSPKSDGGSGFGGIGRWFGFGSSEQTTTAAPAKPAAKPTTAKPAASPKATTVASAKPAAGAIRPAGGAQSTAEKPKVAEATAPVSTTGAIMQGAQPVRSSSGFENRWGGM